MPLKVLVNIKPVKIPRFVNIPETQNKLTLGAHHRIMLTKRPVTFFCIDLVRRPHIKLLRRIILCINGMNSIKKQPCYQVTVR